MKRILTWVILLVIALVPVCARAATLPQDGQYTISVALSGGSGRASVESPAQVTVEDGAATAVVVWSSPYYEHMLLDGVYYYPINSEGNATFAIPVPLDEELPVSAQTIAMSQPHQIEYTLFFDSNTLKPLSAESAVVSWLLVAAGAPLLLIAVILSRRARRKKGDTKGDKR